MINCWRNRLAARAAAWLALLTAAVAESPFKVTALRLPEAGREVVVVRVAVPTNHYLYADQFRVLSEPAGQLLELSSTKPVRHWDAFSEEEKDIFNAPLEARYRVTTPPDQPLRLVIHWAGCNDQVCFFPETLAMDLPGAGSTPVTPIPVVPPPAGGSVEAGSASWRAAAQGFTVQASAAGYLRPRDFLAFLDEAEGRAVAGPPAAGWRQWMARFARQPVAFYTQFGSGLTMLLIVVGGFFLNLTPCVLPMIPVNLAIIGAGSHASSRARGLLLGGVYGLGMALAYGALGGLAVLTGATFGGLNASPWFNLAIAGLFVVLALALWDVLLIDFTRFQTGWAGVPGERRGRLLAALFMGAVSAILSGACVAPVVIAVLVLAGKLHSAGSPVGLLLPFLLGVGMALPWPLAGAGLSFLPRPGRWMMAVKHAFGLLILLLAGYYGFQAYRGFRPARLVPVAAAREAELVARSAATEDALANALQEALRGQRPVFLDFWATWCKNCHAMERTTFRDAAVRGRLASYTVLKYQAERPDAAPAKEVLAFFEVKGLPTYLVLAPRGAPGGN